MKVLAIFLILLVLQVFSTPLDDYVNLPDPTYSYTLGPAIRGPTYTFYNVDLVSQTWLTPQDTNRAVWRHWLTICVPDNVDPHKNFAFLYIEGGTDTDPAPTSLPLVQQILCTTSDTITAEINQVPNEPITFANQGIPQTEDGIVAHTWAHFLNDTTKPYWILELPITKACVRALDTIQALAPTLVPGATVNQFVVGGASKRGWATWTTGLVDRRVKAMVPIVIPILNMVPNLDHHFRAYNGWSWAFGNYVAENVPHYLHTPEFQLLANIIDPYQYLNRLTMPIFMICSTGDEFFVPDSPQFFFDAIPGPHWIRMTPNAGHSEVGHLPDLFGDMSTFYNMIVNNEPIPQFTFHIVKANTTEASITVHSKHRAPTSVLVWTASTISTTLRDFRLLPCPNFQTCFQPAIWCSSSLSSARNFRDENGDFTYVYTATMAPPAAGWSAFFIEVDYTTANNRHLKFSTYLNVVPDIMPFPPCTTNC